MRRTIERHGSLDRAFNAANLHFTAALVTLSVADFDAGREDKPARGAPGPQV